MGGVFVLKVTETKQRLWRGSSYWLALHGLLRVLSYTSRNHLPRDDTAHGELGPLLSVTNQENA